MRKTPTKRRRNPSVSKKRPALTSRALGRGQKPKSYHSTSSTRTPFFYLKIALVVVVIFLLGQFAFRIIHQRGVLGLSTYYDLNKVATLINEERVKYGLAPLKTNAKLANAALAKGENMLLEGYWAHNSESGRQPWDFIDQTGYQYSIAGENLARDFSSEEDMLIAWMNSPTHRANILNPRYQELGLATVEGDLAGETVVLVVNMFANPVSSSNETVASPTNAKSPGRGRATPIPEAVIDTIASATINSAESSETTDAAALFTSGAVLGNNSKPLLTNAQVVQVVFSIATLTTLGILSYKIFFPRRRLIR